MMAPAVSASWASTFLGERQLSDLFLGMHALQASTERWEEATEE